MKKMTKIIILLIIMFTFLSGCFYSAHSDKDGPFVINRINGKTYKYYDGVLVELKKIPTNEFNKRSIIENESTISNEKYKVKSRIKIMTSTILYQIHIIPIATTNADAKHNLQYLINMSDGRLKNQITLELVDKDGFLIEKYNQLLSGGYAKTIDYNGIKENGRYYEGSFQIAFDKAQGIVAFNIKGNI